MSRDPWLRRAVGLFPAGFRQRVGDDLLETAADVLADTPPADRPRVRRRLLGQLIRAGITERLASWFRAPEEPALQPLVRPRARMSSTPHSPIPRPRSSAMELWMHDLRGAVRALSRQPAFALMVILTLGIGLGTSAAMFGVVHGVVLEPLPYAESERMITLYRFYSHQGRESSNMSIPDLRDIQAESNVLESVVGYDGGRMTWMAEGEPELLPVSQVSDGLLEVFRQKPLLGRDLTADDTRLEAPKVMVVSHRFWQHRLGGDPSVLGTVLDLDDELYTVVGVGPEGFAFPEDTRGWVPWQVDTEGCGRDCHLMPTVGRLADGVSLEGANQRLEALSTALETEYPTTNRHKLLAARGLLDEAIAPVRSNLWLLLGAVQLVVLIAAANVANLVLVRGSRRQRELAVRTAVGADRLRLFRQLMLENGLLALGGALVGLLVGQLALAGFLHLAPQDLPRLGEIGLDAEVFGFTALLSVVVLLLFGIAPAFRMATGALRTRGVAGTPSGRRSRFGLLTAEVALALVLLLGAGLLLRSFSEMARIDLGFDPENITRFSLVLPDATYEDPAKVVALTDQLEEALEAIPGVEVAGMALAGPFGHNRISSSIVPLDRPLPEPGEALGANFDIVTPGFFEALRIDTVRGRTFTANDTRQAPLGLVISRSLAERYYPGKDPVGERAQIGVSFGFVDDNAEFTILGVVEDVRAYSLLDEPRPAVYMAQAQTGISYLGMLLRSKPGIDVVPAVRERVRALAPTLPLRSVYRQTAAVDEAYGPQRFYLALLTSFAAIAVLLSAIGLYSVVAYLVSRRTRELAIRMALGADARRILRLVLADALKPASLGIVLGLVVAVFAARILDSFLYGISAHDGLTYLTAPALLLAVALLASLAPALRASRLEPRDALDEE